MYKLEQRWKNGPTIDLQKMPILAKIFIFSDEAHFDLGEYVNKQNCSNWGTENLHEYTEKQMHPKLVTVWCVFLSRGILNCDLTPLDYYLWGAIKDKCYTHNPTSKVLKDNIRATIGEIQLHTIDNVLKNLNAI